MRTYSHLLSTAWLGNRLKRRGVPVDSAALLAGSVLPDLPLTLISIGYVVDRRLIRRHLPDKTRCSPTYNDLYFNNPWWIAAHNILHAPLPLLVLGWVGWLLRDRVWGARLFWFAAGCGLHSAVDIATHVDDGPVLLFPLEWHKRFRSPISYWDPEHGGRRFGRFELLLDLVLAVSGLLAYRRTRTREAAQ